MQCSKLAKKGSEVAILSHFRPSGAVLSILHERGIADRVKTGHDILVNRRPTYGDKHEEEVLRDQLVFTGNSSRSIVAVPLTLRNDLIIGTTQVSSRPTCRFELNPNCTYLSP